MTVSGDTGGRVSSGRRRYLLTGRLGVGGWTRGRGKTNSCGTPVSARVPDSYPVRSSQVFNS